MAQAALRILATRKTQKARIRQAVDPTAARERLTDFCKYVDPGAAEEYDARHLRLVAEKLEAVERGDIKRLMLFLPPRHWKSSLASEKFPAWFFGRNPKKKIICVGYGAELVEGFSSTVRETIGSNAEYRNVFPDVRLKKGKEAVGEWALEGAHRASYRAAGIGGAITGKGADILLIDDPVADAQSLATKQQRDKTYEYYRTKLRNRLEPGGAIILIMTRWHEDDLAGRLLKEARDGRGEQWEVLCLPAVAEPAYRYPWEAVEETVSDTVEPSEVGEVSPAIVEQIDAIGRKEGEYLWPERYPPEEYEALRLASGSRSWSALYQQRPRSAEGSILDSMLLKMIEAEDLPPMKKTCRRWDLAFSERNGADRLAGAKCSIDFKGNFYIQHMKRLKGRWTQSKPAILRQAEVDGPEVVVGIESNGTQLGYYQDIYDAPEMRRFKVEEDKPRGDKPSRADIWGSRLPDGVVYCVKGQWNQEFFDEMDAFPHGENDDQVDGVSGAWQMLHGPAGTANPVLPSQRYKGIKRQ